MSTYPATHRGMAHEGTMLLKTTFIRLPFKPRSAAREQLALTIPSQSLLAVRLPVAEPVQAVLDRVRALILVILPSWMHECLHAMESRAWGENESE